MDNIYGIAFLEWAKEDGTVSGDGLPIPGPDSGPNAVTVWFRSRGFSPEEARDFMSQPFIRQEERDREKLYGNCYTLVTDLEAFLRWVHAHGGLTDEQLELELAAMTLDMAGG